MELCSKIQIQYFCSSQLLCYLEASNYSEKMKYTSTPHPESYSCLNTKFNFHKSLFPFEIPFILFSPNCNAVIFKPHKILFLWLYTCCRRQITYKNRNLDFVKVRMHVTIIHITAKYVYLLWLLKWNMYTEENLWYINICECVFRNWNVS